MYGCMLLAVDVVGKKITTVEGLLAKDGKLSPVQQAFVEKDAMMCGFCTPGFVMSVQALLQHNPNPTLEEVQERLRRQRLPLRHLSAYFRSGAAAKKG